MENFSENKEPEKETPPAPKRGRGRPSRFNKQLMAELAPGLHAYGRTLQNRIYESRAVEALKTEPDEYQWILEKRLNGNRKRSALLAEIGRLGRPDFIKQAAAYLCRNKPKVTDGIKYMKKLRLELFKRAKQEMKEMKEKEKKPDKVNDG